MLDQYGFVIGINTWGIQDSQNLNFAVHVSELSRLVYNKMTMQKFYEVTTDTPIIKSCNKLKKWITNNYTDSEENLLGFSEHFTDENAETTYTIIYDTEQKSLYIAGESYHKDGSKAMFGLRLYQDSVMCNYVGSYTDSEGQSNRCEGYVNCTTFYEGSTLTCEENSGGSWPEKKLMKYYTDCLLDCLGWFAVASEEYDMGISLYDLGFTHF